jgi:hypothetical protein
MILQLLLNGFFLSDLLLNSDSLDFKSFNTSATPGPLLLDICLGYYVVGNTHIAYSGS